MYIINNAILHLLYLLILISQLQIIFIEIFTLLS